MRASPLYLFTVNHFFLCAKMWRSLLSVSQGISAPSFPVRQLHFPTLLSSSCSHALWRTLHAAAWENEWLREGGNSSHAVRFKEKKFSPLWFYALISLSLHIDVCGRQCAWLFSVTYDYHGQHEPFYTGIRNLLSPYVPVITIFNAQLNLNVCKVATSVWLAKQVESWRHQKWAHIWPRHTWGKACGHFQRCHFLHVPLVMEASRLVSAKFLERGSWNCHDCLYSPQKSFI